MSVGSATISYTAAQTIGSFASAQTAITGIDAALSGVSEIRGKLGGISNRLNSTIANMDQVRVNLSASQGRIEDADFAKESANLARTQVLQQASMAMLSQANAQPQTVLSLLQG